MLDEDWLFTTALDHLEAHLLATPVAAPDAKSITETLTVVIAEWATAADWHVQREFVLESGFSVSHPNRTGRVDLVIRHPVRPLAIEIDRSNKNMSIEKLIECVRRGMQPVWVRWGRSDNWPSPHHPRPDRLRRTGVIVSPAWPFSLNLRAILSGLC